MNTKTTHLMVVASVPEGKASVQSFLGELNELYVAASEDLETVGIAYNRRAAMHLIDTTQPDVLVIDLMLPGLRSIEIITYVSGVQPDVKILAFSPGDPPYDRVILAIQAGALGYVCKDAEPTEIFEAIHTVLRGENYLPQEATYDVLQQVAPELRVVSQQTRGRLIEVLLAFIPLAGIVAAFTEFLWREYWGKIGVRVVDLGVDASTRATEFMGTLLLLLGFFGPLLFIPTWVRLIGSWIEHTPGLKSIITNMQNIKVLRFLFTERMGSLVLALGVLLITIPLDISGGTVLSLVIGAVITIVLLAHILGMDAGLPDFLQLPPDRVRRYLAVVGGLILALMLVLSAEVFLRGPDLRADGLHGFIAPKALDLTARPAMIYDLDEKHEPLGVLYLGGNADLYVLYDPCKKTVRFIPVGSSRVEFVDKVQCPPDSRSVQPE